MDKEKMSIQELVDQLSEQANISKKAAEDFVRNLIGTLEETLLDGDSVKIKDFGTLKSQWVEARKSVNVQTGEEIIIDGYYKVNFIPENSLKEAVNQPFAHLEATPVDDEPANFEKGESLRNFAEQANEIKSIISDIEALDPKEKKEKEEGKSIENNSYTQSPNNLNEMKENEKNYDNDEFVFGPTEEDSSDDYQSDEYDDDYDESGGGKKWLWIILIILLLIAIAGGIIYFVNPDFYKNLGFGKDAKIEQVIETVEETPVLTADEEFDLLFNTPRTYNEFIATVPLPRFSYLASLSREYYGHPYFWVYIYEANKAAIDNPDFVLAKTSIKIPKVNPLLIDASNPRALEKARELHDLYKK